MKTKKLPRIINNLNRYIKCGHHGYIKIIWRKASYTKNQEQRHINLPISKPYQNL